MTIPLSQRAIDLWQSFAILALAGGLLTLTVIVSRILAIIRKRHE